MSSIKVFTIALLAFITLVAAQGGFINSCNITCFGTLAGYDEGYLLAGNCALPNGTIVHSVMDMNQCVGLNNDGDMIFMNK